LTKLDPDLLRRNAEQSSGLADWGEPPFEEALSRLCQSARDESGQDADGLARFGARLTALLITRLQLYADRAQFPEIAAQEIVAPIIVTGLPRGGTTILHALLAQDPAARAPQSWEVAAPSPPPREESYTSDPRIAAVQTGIDALPATFKAMHAMGATLPEECNSIMQLAFLSPNFGASLNLPSYMAWLIEAADVAPAFAVHRHVLQTLQAFAPRKWWALKSPPYLWWPEALFSAYPDAWLVVTHRDPAEVMASNASLIAFLRGMSGPVDRHFVGAEQVDQWAIGLERMESFRAAFDAPKAITDVYYRDFVADPIAVVEQVYAAFGINLSAPARKAMEQFMASNQQGKHGKHDYAAADYGLEPAALRMRFADYIARRAIPVQS
jgi:hypothetical protein